MSKKKVLLVDMDVLCYRASCAAEERSVNVKHLPSGREKVFKNRTAFKDSLKLKNFEYKPDDYEITDIQEAEPIAHVCRSIKTSLNRIKEDIKPDVTELWIAGADNFRDDLPLPSKYKGTRTDIRPIQLDEAKKYALTLGARQSKGSETDDFLELRAYYWMNQGYDAIVATIDKDSKQFTGTYVYDFTKGGEPELIGDLGELHESTNKSKSIKGSGFKWWAMQMKADKTDNYDVLDFVQAAYNKKPKCSDKEWFNMLVDLETKQEVFSAIVKKYKELFPAPFTYTDWKGEVHEECDWLYVMKIMHKCCRMQVYPNDPVNLYEFMKQEGVTFNESLS